MKATRAGSTSIRRRMYDLPASAVYPDLVKLAGGTASVVKLARERVEGGRAVEALHLTEVALSAEPNNRAALEARLAALQALVAACRNSNERGWLDYSVKETKRKLAAER